MRNLERRVTIDPSELRRAKAEYDRDGATVLRNVLSAERIERLRDAVDRQMEAPVGDHISGEIISAPGKSRFYGRMFAWLEDSDYRELVFDSDLAEIAGELMGSNKVRFFYDHTLVKEPGAENRTPWHQDLPYWPVSGEQVISLWLSLDTATPENGVVTYVKGSHRWNRFFAMQNWGESEKGGAEQVQSPGGIYDDANARGERKSLLDIRENPQNYEFLSWSVEPGDILVHHPLTIHGANGNMSSSSPRRAISTRWFGDDARWDDSRPHFLTGQAGRENFPYPDIEQGGELDAPLFPLRWERKVHSVDEASRSGR